MYYYTKSGTLPKIHFKKIHFGKKLRSWKNLRTKSWIKVKIKLGKKLKKKVGKGRQKVEKTWGKVEEQKIGGKLENKNGKS